MRDVKPHGTLGTWRGAADRGIWETEGPWEPGVAFPHSSPVEATQQMAELSEVLALRMENYEQQWREVAQLQGRVMKLQCCSRSVRRGVCGASSSCHSPLEPMPPSPCPTQWIQLRGLSLVSESELEETSGGLSSCPLVPSRGLSLKRDTVFPGNRPRDSTFFGFVPCDFCFKEMVTPTDVPGETCWQQGLQGCGETWGGVSLALGPSSMGLRL